MNIEQLRQSGYIQYEVISGSHAYGMQTETSDVDRRGVYVLPTEQILVGGYPQQIADEKNDIVFYEVGKFLSMALGSNPNVMELFNIPEDCIIFSSKFFTDHVLPLRDGLLCKNLRNTFGGYAVSQIKKARGLNKKITWEESRVKRKDCLDFCYVLLEKEQSIKFKKYAEKMGLNWKELQSKIGLACVNNFPSMYSMYYLDEGGIIGNDSNSVRSMNIPKDAEFMGYLRFDMNAYSTHCKDYREYTKWLKDRNEHRYKENLKKGAQFDLKNMSHCIRLLNMAEDIAIKKKIIVRRSEKDYLLDIRKGMYDYEELLQKAEKKIALIDELFEKSSLPQRPDEKGVKELLLKIRLDNLHGNKTK